MSYLAPAGTPVSTLQYSGALLDGLRAGVDERLAESLARHAGHAHCRLFSTGRAAMVVGLQALRDITPDARRTEVIVAGYTCYSVPASVLRAGLQPRLCDVNPRTLSLDLDDLKRFDMSRVLAIVSANLYGLPNDLERLETFARDAGVAFLDDAAQALGARHAGRPVGGFGDLGLYSFDKGKNITSLAGGALVTGNAALAAAIDRRWQGLETERGLPTAVKLAAYAMLLRPWLYGLVRRLPFLGLGRTVYEDDYPLRRYAPLLAGFAAGAYARLPELTRVRTDNANALRAALGPLATLEQVQLPARTEPGYTRLPVLVRDESRRAACLAALDQAGIGATASYPAALADVPELAGKFPDQDRHQPGARQVARRIMTLPVHPYCPRGYATRVARILAELEATPAHPRLQNS